MIDSRLLQLKLGEETISLWRKEILEQLPSEVTYLIACHRNQGEYYAREMGFKTREAFHIITRAEQLRGLRNIKVVRVGQYYKGRDSHEIEQMLEHINYDRNKEEKMKGGYTVLATNPSKSSSAIHEVRRGKDDVVYCTCKGWQNYKKCRHLAEFWLAQSSPDGVPVRKAHFVMEEFKNTTPFCMKTLKAEIVLVTGTEVSDITACLKDVTDDTITVNVKKEPRVFMRSKVMVLSTADPMPKGKFKKNVIIKWLGSFEKGAFLEDVVDALTA